MPSCSATAIAYKAAQIVTFRQHNKRVLGTYSLGICSLCMRKNAYLRASSQNPNLAIRDVHANGIPNGNGNPMEIPRELE